MKIFHNSFKIIYELLCFIFVETFKEGKVACCGNGPFRAFHCCGGRLGVKDYELDKNPYEYVFFESVHSTDRPINFMLSTDGVDVAM